MTTYARVASGRVVELLDVPHDQALSDLFHEDLVAECHELPYGAPARVGWTFDGHDFHEPPVPPRVTVISSQEFLGRLAQDEKVAMMASFSTHPPVFMFLLSCMSAPTVDLAAQPTLDGIHGARDAGILSAARAEQVLA